MKFILGKKIGMSQIFSEEGTAIPITLIQAMPNRVIQIRTKEKDGYEAVQLGAGEKKKVSKPLRGHFKDFGVFAFIREIRTAVSDGSTLKAGDAIEVSVFNPGDKVKITGTTKGKGFAGAMKRHGFHGMPASHGHKHVKRHIGSIGQRFPQHTLKGKRMAGHMGNRKFTVRGLEVVGVDPKFSMLALKGAVPGNRGGWVTVAGI